MSFKRKLRRKDVVHKCCKEKMQIKVMGDKAYYVCLQCGKTILCNEKG